MNFMKVFSIFLATFILIILFVACENLIEGPEDEPGTGDGVITQTTFTDIQKTVFNTNCALSTCHDGTNSPNLSAGNSYDNLVNVPSGEVPSLLRVKPGDSDNSYVIRKLTGQGTARMPPTPRPALSQSTIDSIADWIDRGALNN